MLFILLLIIIYKENIYNSGSPHLFAYSNSFRNIKILNSREGGIKSGDLNIFRSE